MAGQLNPQYTEDISRCCTSVETLSGSSWKSWVLEQVTSQWASKAAGDVWECEGVAAGAADCSYPAAAATDTPPSGWAG